jgi:hypothetical protein
MSKRFTETTKWDDPWFRKLQPCEKLLWLWLLDRCDAAGVIDPDLDLAAFQIGYGYPMDTLSVFGDRVVTLANGKQFIPKFIGYQYGRLSPDCKPHNQVFAALEKNGINATDLQEKGYPKGMDTLKDKDKIKTRQEKDSSLTGAKAKAEMTEVLAFVESIGLPPQDGEWVFHKWEGNGWSNGGKPIKDWKATLRSWKAGQFFPSQKGQKPTGTRNNHAGMRQPEIIDHGF